MVISESPMPSPRNMITLRACPPTTALRGPLSSPWLSAGTAVMNSAAAAASGTAAAASDQRRAVDWEDMRGVLSRGCPAELPDGPCAVQPSRATSTYPLRNLRVPEHEQTATQFRNDRS